MGEHVPSGYKQTKVGVIPEDWDVVKLGDIFQFKNGLNKGKEFFGHGTPIVNYVDVNKNNALKVEDIKGLVSVAPSELQNHNVEKGDVFFTRTSETIDEIGLSAVILDDVEDTVFSGFVLRARPTSKLLDNLYKKYCFTTYMTRKEIIKKSSYTTRALTNGRFLSEVIIALPPLKEQQKIAQILTTWDDAISKQEALIKAKEQLKKGLMQKLLSGEVRFDGFGGEWEEVLLEDIASIITTKNIDTSVDMIFSNSAVNGIVIQNEFFDKDIANRDNLTGYYIVESGDFVYNPRISKHAPSGPINRNRHAFPGIVSPLYTVFRTSDNEIIDYLEFFFSSTLWFRYMKAIANYGARYDRMNITNNDFMKMPIPYPSKEEQRKIAQALILVDKEIDLLSNELKTLKEQKRGLMQRLLSGEVRTNKIRERDR